MERSIGRRLTKVVVRKRRKSSSVEIPLCPPTTQKKVQLSTASFRLKKLQLNLNVGFRRFVCCGFALCRLLAFSFRQFFVGSLIPGEVRERGRSPVEITSSDPISVSTPAVPRTVPDVDAVTDSDYVVSALFSIDTLVPHPSKRDGTAMSEVGGAQSTSPTILGLHR